MAGELFAAFHRLFADEQIRSVAVAGAGEAFCAVGDLRQMGQCSELPAHEAYAWPTDIVELHRLMLRAPKPVVAAVDGPAYAGGMGLAGMCDVILATGRSSFALPKARIGLFPMIIAAHLSRAIPRNILLEMMLTGEPIDAEETTGWVS